MSLVKENFKSEAINVASIIFFLKKVLSYVHEENIASTKVLLNNNFILEANLKKKIKI